MRRRGKLIKSTMLILLISVILTGLMTYPLIFKLTTHIPGFFSSDEPFGNLWENWRIKYSFANNISLRRTDFISYPYGIDLNGFGLNTYLWTAVQYLLNYLTTPVLTYNLQVFINFLLTFIFSYFLGFYLLKDKFGAVLSAIIFTFCPYMFSRAWQHFILTYNQWMPLVLLAAISLKERPGLKQAFIFLVCLVLLFSFDYSIAYLGVVSLTTFFIYILFFQWKIKISGKKLLIPAEDFNYFKKALIAGLGACMILFFQFFPMLKNRLAVSAGALASDFNLYHRPFEHLFLFSSKPLSYLLPAAVHPIFGKFTEQFIGSQLYGVSFTEHTLYLGWVPLILAFIAFRRWRKSHSFYIGFFIFLAVMAWLFSQPPWWKFGPLKIFMPSYFMYKILPMFRAYCRFGIVVMLAVAVLAGYGLKFILERFKSRKMKFAVTCLFSGLVLFEFWNWPAYKIIDVSEVPQVYYWLKGQPADSIIAEYPLDVGSPSEMYKFYQTKHEKKIINFTIPGTYAHKLALTMTELSNPRTAGLLKWLGVKYVLVHREAYLKSDLVQDRRELEKVPYNRGIKLVKSFPPEECPQKNIMCVRKTGAIDVYEITVKAIEPEVKE